MKPSGPESQPGIRIAGGQLTAGRVSLHTLIRMAYRVQDYQISGGPKWLRDDAFDVTAKPEHPVSSQEMELRLQSLLADRFQLKLRRESKEQPVYALVPAKRGAKLAPASAGDEGNFGGRPGAAPGTLRLTSTNTTLAHFASMLSGLVGHIVLDQTGITGNFAIEVEFARDQIRTVPSPENAPPEQAGPSVFRALEDQLGLKLEARRAPVEMLVVESAERPDAN